MHLTLCKVILADLVYFQCSWKMGPLRDPPWFHPHLSAVITADPDSHNRNSSVSCCQPTTADYWVRDSGLIESYQRVHYFKTTFLISHLMHSFEHRSFCVTQEFSTVRKVVFFYFVMDIRLESINNTYYFQIIRTSADLHYTAVSIFPDSSWPSLSFFSVSCHKLLNLVLRIQKYHRSYFSKYPMEAYFCHWIHFSLNLISKVWTFFSHICEFISCSCAI